MSTSILLADDHPVVLKGLVDLLKSSPYSVVATCSDGSSALSKLRELRPHLAVLDLMLPGLSGLEVARVAMQEGLPTRMILLTASSNEAQLAEMMRSGAAAVLTKDLGEQFLMDALRTVSEGGEWFSDSVRKAAQRVEQSGLRSLSGREREIARLAAAGLQNKQIAYKLELSEGTVKIHLYNIYNKLNVRSRMELALVLNRDEV